MKKQLERWLGRLMMVVISFSLFEDNLLWAQQPAASSQAPPAASQNTPAAQPSATATAQDADASAANPAAPPSEAPKKSQADLEKLAAPIALYPDPLIAVVLPASAYPLEVVQAARFVKDTNNIAKLDEQPWDDNVKAVARYPDAISQMDQNIAWTSDLGDAFINQPKELMDAVQTMRGKARDSGALKTTEQQTVNVSSTVVTNIVESREVYVTNQVVQVQPANPEVIYVPQYNPTVVYAGYPVAYPGYYYPPYYPGTVAAASIVSFGAGMAMGAWMANGCNWGGGHVDVHVNNNYNRNINSDRNVNRNSNVNRDRTSNRANSNQSWKPDQNRLKNSGSSLSSAQNREARGYGNNQAANRTGTGNAANRASTANAGNRAATANAGNRAAGANTANRASTANAGTRPSAGAGSRTAGAGSAQASTANRSGNLSSTGNRSGSAGAAQQRSAPSTRSSSGSAFSGGNASSARSSSARGASSRGFSGGGGGMSRGGGGGRGGGGRR